MALGGILRARRVARSLAFGVIEVPRGKGLTANLVTSAHVLLASSLGVPVSTTHDSVGALFGVGAAGRSLHRRTALAVAAAWIVTLPAAGVLSAVAYAVLSRL